jgi:hypothetical protein
MKLMEKFDLFRHPPSTSVDMRRRRAMMRRRMSGCCDAMNEGVVSQVMIHVKVVRDLTTFRPHHSPLQSD